MSKEQVEVYAALLARLHKLPVERTSLPFWEGADMSDAEINKILHKMHIEEPGIRTHAIHMLAEEIGCNVMATYPMCSTDYDALLEFAAKIAVEVEKRFDAACTPSWSYITTHTDEDRSECPVLWLYALGDDLKDACEFLKENGWDVI